MNLQAWEDELRRLHADKEILPERLRTLARETSRVENRIKDLDVDIVKTELRVTYFKRQERVAELKRLIKETKGQLRSAQRAQKEMERNAQAQRLATATT